jgi:hypothetical protein
LAAVRTDALLGKSSALMRRIALASLGCGCLLLSACGANEIDIVGRWNSAHTSMVSLEFYPDGVAALSGTGLLNLRWKRTNPAVVRIEALDSRVFFNFRISRDDSGPRGVLELAGYEALVFRKVGE